MKPNLCNPGKIDKDCAELKARVEVRQEQVQDRQVDSVALRQIKGLTHPQIAKEMDLGERRIAEIATSPKVIALREKYQASRFKNTKRHIAKINQKHRTLITGKGWDSNDAPKANVELRAIIHADKLMGLGQDVAPAQNVATDLVGAAQAELAGLMLLFVRPDKQKELQTVEAEVVEPDTVTGQGDTKADRGVG